MKRFIFIAVLFVFLKGHSQDTAPSGLKILYTYSVAINPADTSMWLYEGNNKWLHLLGVRDSTKTKGGYASIFRVSKLVALKDSTSGVKGYATFHALRSKVPYTGATSNVNLGSYTITAGDHIQTSSDERVKKDIKKITILSGICKINFYSYSLKSDSTNKVKYGVLAQEVEKHFPELVFESQGVKAVAYTEILILKVAYLEQCVTALLWIMLAMLAMLILTLIVKWK